MLVSLQSVQTNRFSCPGPLNSCLPVYNYILLMTSTAILQQLNGRLAIKLIKSKDSLKP
jgi:hypothetical protein